MAETPQGALRVVSPQELAEQDREAERVAMEQERDTSKSAVDYTGLVGHIRKQWEIMRNHRESSAGADKTSINERLLKALRAYHGVYDNQKLQEIKKFGGSKIYARIIAGKCRGASALLRDVYLGAERPWALDATPEPTLPDDIMNSVTQLVQQEIALEQEAGGVITPAAIQQRISELTDAAKQAAVKNARKEAKQAQTRVEDILVEGEFYKALQMFLVDLPIFPYAVLKGPVVRIAPQIKWVNGELVSENTAKLFWQRVSPFDYYWMPGASDAEDSDVIEVVRYTRADLNRLMGVAGYDEDAIRRVLTEHGKEGLYDWFDGTSTERAHLEDRESPFTNRSNLMHGIEYHGYVQGKDLVQYDLGDEIEDIDEDRDYFVQAWVVGREVIKVQFAPSPRKRHPYYVTSFDKVPGTPVGNALPDILEDVQDVCNAAARAMVNNMSISSGPQVVILSDRFGNTEDTDSLYPWKRWHMKSDPLGQSSAQNKPVEFFQPQSNSQELMGVYEKWSQIGDELSAIPRYLTGSERMGGAGRTASGLAMLMGNASKVLQNVAANVDRDVIEPCLRELYDMIMLTDETGILRGDEQINVRGVTVAIQKETERMRKLEFLQMTANPIDMQITGVEGRANVLRSVSEDLGMDGERIVPTEAELEAKQRQQEELAKQQAQAAALEEGGAQAQGNQQELGGQNAPLDNMVPSGPGPLG